LRTGTHVANQAVVMPLYHETAYYNAVRNRWFGLADYATDQPDRLDAPYLCLGLPSPIAGPETHSLVVDLP
jgi:hypothetical protein